VGLGQGSLLSTLLSGDSDAQSAAAADGSSSTPRVEQAVSRATQTAP
jgi:hypothetical protein